MNKFKHLKDISRQAKASFEEKMESIYCNRLHLIEKFKALVALHPRHIKESFG